MMEDKFKGNKMNIEDLTIGEAREIASLINGVASNQYNNPLDKEFIGKKCIIRTYSAGVWFGEVSQKCNN